MSLSLRYAALSDVGRVRKDNQDSGYVGPHLILVADGVGGAARGDIASSATVEAMRKLDVDPGNDSLSELAATLHLAHDRLAEIVEQHRELDGTSTTVSAAVFDGTHLQVAHVGDSRAYLLRDGVLRQITSDHTLVQSLVDEGRITEDEARVHPHRNLILRAVDGVHEPEPDLFAVDVRAGDRLLFCSDGCSGSLDVEQMAALMTGEPLEDVCARLVRSALDAGSSDNVTVLVAEVAEGPGDVAPLLVGAAALAPHRMIVNDRTGNLSEADVAGLADATGLEEIDPEELRYAPQAPPRGRWWRRLLAVLLLLGLIGGAGYGAYQYSQTRYFVSDSAGKVAIFKGVNFDLPGLTLNHLVERTDIDLADIEAFADDVRSGKDFSSLRKARVYAAGLNPLCQQSSSTSTPASGTANDLAQLGLRQVQVETFSTPGMPADPNAPSYWVGDPARLACPGAP